MLLSTQLPRQRAGHAAELCVVLVGAILGFYDQLAVGKVWVVRTLGGHGDVLDRDGHGG